MASQTKLFDNYQTDDSANSISLAITIGYAQIASTSLSIDNTPLVTTDADENGDFGDSFTVTLGKNADLKSKVLAISTKVTRDQPTTSSSLLIELDGGVTNHQYSLLSGTLANLNDSIDYYAEITFN